MFLPDEYHPNTATSPRTSAILSAVWTENDYVIKNARGCIGVGRNFQTRQVMSEFIDMVSNYNMS